MPDMTSAVNPFSSAIGANNPAAVHNAPTIPNSLSFSTDYYLKLEGIEGESPARGHETEIQLVDWSFGCSQTGTAELGSGVAASGRVTMNDFTFVKLMDKATPKLFEHMMSGRFIKSAWLTARRSGLQDGNQLDYLKVEFRDVLVSGQTSTGANQGEVPVETVTLRFAWFKFFYREIDKGVAGGAISGGWDIKQNIKA